MELNSIHSLTAFTSRVFIFFRNNHFIVFRARRVSLKFSDRNFPRFLYAEICFSFHTLSFVCPHYNCTPLPPIRGAKNRMVAKCSWENPSQRGGRASGTDRSAASTPCAQPRRASVRRSSESLAAGTLSQHIRASSLSLSPLPLPTRPTTNVHIYTVS